MPSETLVDTRAVAPPLDEYARAWRLRNEARTADLRRLVADARAEALRLADMLVHDFRASRVILFGSVARGDPRRTDFDIDLAVAGIAAERWFEAGGAARLASTRRVEIVNLEAVRDALRDRILTEGIVLRG